MIEAQNLPPKKQRTSSNDGACIIAYILRDLWHSKEGIMITCYVKTMETLSQHSKKLVPLQAGDHLFLQNQTGSSPGKEKCNYHLLRASRKLLHNHNLMYNLMYIPMYLSHLWYLDPQETHHIEDTPDLNADAYPARFPEPMTRPLISETPDDDSSAQPPHCKPH